MKIIRILMLISLGYILAHWYFTSTRPDDWFIALMLSLFWLDNLLEIITTIVYE